MVLAMWHHGGQSNDTADRPRRVKGSNMHILRPPFRMEDSAAIEFAARRGFGLVAASERGEPIASHVPFVVRLYEGVVTVEFHVTALLRKAGVTVDGPVARAKAPATAAEVASVESPPVERIVDTTGAGDIFGGSAMYGLLKAGGVPEKLTAEELEKIVSFACTSAGISTTKAGGISSVPELAEVEAAMK